jgi:hypothetical protein
VCDGTVFNQGSWTVEEGKLAMTMVGERLKSKPIFFFPT